MLLVIWWSRRDLTSIGEDWYSIYLTRNFSNVSFCYVMQTLDRNVFEIVEGTVSATYDTDDISARMCIPELPTISCAYNCTFQNCVFYSLTIVTLRVVHYFITRVLF